MTDGLEATAYTALGRRLDPASTAPIALGLSGGGDSLALLLVTQTWAARQGRRLLALTVDHRLNPDSGAWTAFAGAAAARAGAEWCALPWEGAKPTTGLPAAARQARHRLLAQAAREAGAEVVLLGHTLDDRREAELMRRRDAPTLGALREWAPSPVWPEGRRVFLLRPLLDLSRLELREWLTARGQAWIDDPANDDPRFARARARRALNPSPPVGEGGARAPQARGRERGRTDVSGEGGATPLPPIASDGPLPLPQGERGFTSDGRIILERRPLDRRLLAASLLCASGTDTPPRGERLERLVEALQGPGPVAASLAGARVSADGDAVHIGREAGERARGGLAPVALRRGETAVWDGRFEVVADVEGLTVEALAGRVGRLSRPERLWLKTLPPSARSALPVLVAADGAVALPRPFGDGPATAVCLVDARLAAACGLISREGQRPS